MTTLTPTDLVTLRTGHPHISKLYMSVFKPIMLYKGQVAGTPTFGARYITVTDISGDITLLEDGYTVKVKDVDDNLVCKRRYRSRSGQVLKLDENTVDWSTSYTIEVYKQRELWTIYPYIDDSDDYIFYKDYDILYSDQNTRIPPVAIAGSSQVGFLDGGSITFPLDGSESYIMAPAATAINSYAWSCDTGVIASSTSAITSITFSTPGQHIVKLTVTDDLDSTQSTYRIFFVHERSGVNVPYTDFELDSITCSWSGGGSSARVTMHNSSSITDIEDGAYIVIWSECWYNSVKQDIGRFGNIRFAGYVLSESIQKSLETNEVVFNVGTIDALMKNMRMFSVSLEAVASGKQALTWYQFPYNTLTVARSIHHLWKWHSTLLEVADVFLPITNTSVLTACDDMSDGNLFTLVNWTYENGIFAKLYCDQIGAVRLETDSLMLDETERNALDTYMDIIATDLKFEQGVQVDRRTDTPTAMVTASGVAFVGSTFTPLMSQAPGTIPGNYGDNVSEIERLVLSDQNQLNMISGRLYAIANSDISEIRLEFAGDYPIDISPKNWYTFTIPATYTHRGIAIDVRMQCRDVTYNISMSEGVIYPSCVFEVDVDSVDGVTVAYPDDVETPYAPVPPYTPYIPYIPNISPIYPIVPSQPAPNYPGAAPSPIADEEPVIPAIDPLCNTTLGYDANGPYFVYSGTVYKSVIIPVRFFLRGTNFTNVTRYTINGRFFDIDPTDGTYRSTISDNFYTIYALDCMGTRVATGIHDSVVGVGYQRTGHFNAPAGIDICYIEIAVDNITAVSLSYLKGVGYTSWDTLAYVEDLDTEIFTSSVDASDGTAHMQLSNFSCRVHNPPWIWTYTGAIEVRADFSIPHYPQWFEVVANLYPSELGTPLWYIATPEAYASGATYGINMLVKAASAHSGYNGVDLDMRSKFPGSPPNNTSWLTLITTIKPLLYKLTIDSLLLWNICEYTS